MCGISGRIGMGVAAQLIEDLKKLEYRGYDSAGIGLISDDKIFIKKRKGSPEKLQKYSKLGRSVGIAHTRWATHGSPSAKNAHPHLSYGGKWAIVHNGIIENAQSLKTQLDVPLKSETDSEIIAHLLEKFGSGIDAVASVVKLLKGSFAVAAINVDFPENIFIMRRHSPLYFAFNKNGSVISSDIVTFCEGEYYELGEDEYGEISQFSFVIYDKNGKKVEKTAFLHKKEDNFQQKQVFKHKMLSEIFQTPNTIQNIMDYFLNPPKIDFSQFDKIYLFGCGSAYHTCLMGEKFFAENMGREARAFIASEAAFKTFIDEKTLCIFVSQSGETADTMEVVDYAKICGAKRLLITNNIFSSMAKKCEKVIPMLAGQEEAVASTKAYTAGVLVLYMLSGLEKNQTKDQLDKLLKLRQIISILLVKKYDFFIKKLKKCKKCFFIGRDYDNITAREGCLKLKEISYLNCISFPAGELKHGTLALVDRRSLTIAIASQKELFNKLESNIKEIASRGGEVVLLATENLGGCFESVDKQLDGLIITVYLQLLSYHYAVSRGLNPDKPRNLAKSVTVG